MSGLHRREHGLRDLYDYLAPPPPRRGRPPKHDLRAWRVVDDWPPDVPVTAAELDVLEARLGDLLDELLGTPAPAGEACREGERK